VLGEPFEIVPASPDTEFSIPFLQGMVNRMGVSWAKYGAVADAYPHKINALDSLQMRLDKYRETGNTEWLIDVANFAMIEFLRPSHPRAHFAGTDSDESPGRVKNDGLVVKTMRNEQMLEARRV
jgi:hypothetical protein